MVGIVAVARILEADHDQRLLTDLYQVGLFGWRGNHQ